MKNSAIKTNFHRISVAAEKDGLENEQNKANFSSKAVKTMPEQLITPPARVWDKIQAILDEQDNRRKSADDLIKTSFGVNVAAASRKKFYFLTAAGLSLLAGLVWVIR